jgi:hypothetical protein
MQQYLDQNQKPKPKAPILGAFVAYKPKSKSHK